MNTDFERLLAKPASFEERSVRELKLSPEMDYRYMDLMRRCDRLTAEEREEFCYLMNIDA